MAGHSKFHNIKNRKSAQDNKRARHFTKLQKDMEAAVKIGGSDIKSNPRLRMALLAAKSMNMPREKIDSAIDKASSVKDTSGNQYEEVRYEGYISGNIALIIEAVTDNRNRTAASIRTIFNKCGGSMGETGSVSYMFDKRGILAYDKSTAEENEILEFALEVGSEDFEILEDQYKIVCQALQLHEIGSKFTKKYGDPKEFTIAWIPQNLINITDLETANKILKIVDKLEEDDDIQSVYGNYHILEETIE